MIEANSITRLCVQMERDEAKKLQKAWTRSGDFSNRSQYIKAAVNAYAGEKIFNVKEDESL